MRVLGVVAMLLVLIGLAFLVGVGLEPAEIACEVPAGSLNLSFDDVEAAPRVAECTCSCEPCLEAKALCSYDNGMNRSQNQEWCNTNRSAACVIPGTCERHVSNSLNHTRQILEQFRCCYTSDYMNSSGRFTGAAA